MDTMVPWSYNRRVENCNIGLCNIGDGYYDTAKQYQLVVHGLLRSGFLLKKAQQCKKTSEDYNFHGNVY